MKLACFNLGIGWGRLKRTFDADEAFKDLCYTTREGFLEQIEAVAVGKALDGESEFVFDFLNRRERYILMRLNNKHRNLDREAKVAAVLHHHRGGSDGTAGNLPADQQRAIDISTNANILAALAAFDGTGGGPP